jgi:hypothetical protein
VLTDIKDFICYSYSNLESVIIICSYDLSVSNKLIHQSKPHLQVTITCDSTTIHATFWCQKFAARSVMDSSAVVTTVNMWTTGVSSIQT